MTDATFSATLERIRRHCALTEQKAVTLSFHGGEPCLIGPGKFMSWCDAARRRLEGVAEVRLALQTNGTLIDREWVRALSECGVQVGVSVDGPQAVNDANRVDHKNRGTYDATARGIALLRAAETPFGILTVINFDADPVATHRHLVALGPRQVSYLLPDFNHESIGPIRRRYGPTPCADYLMLVFDDWWENGTLDVSVNPFLDMARIIMGGESRSDYFGNGPLNFAVVNTDGRIEWHDVLRICGEDFTGTGLSVHANDFAELAMQSGVQARATTTGVPQPSSCGSCPEGDTCGGGHLPHRYSRARGFDNPSAWCPDLLALFTHVRRKLGVPVEETERRRKALSELAAPLFTQG